MTNLMFCWGWDLLLIFLFPSQTAGKETDKKSICSQDYEATQLEKKKASTPIVSREYILRFCTPTCNFAQ